ncbi:hypothetical protein AGMMS49975_10860 [Clostridia bacterium]|nr:hypothetical protein AGMMS49975_10860 [Clostridia bacterium]
MFNEYLESTIDNLGTITSRILGTGGVVLKLCIDGEHIDVDIIPQDRFLVIESSGKHIRKAGFIAETIQKNNRQFTRIEYHTLENDGLYTIEQRALQEGR